MNDDTIDSTSIINHIIITTLLCEEITNIREIVSARGRGVHELNKYIITHFRDDYIVNYETLCNVVDSSLCDKFYGDI